MLLVPLCAYGLYLALEGVVHGGYTLFGANTLERQFGVLGGVLLMFLAALALGSQRRNTGKAGNERDGDVEVFVAGSANRSPRWHRIHLHGPRHIFHIFALVGFFCLPFAARGRGVLAVTFVVWLLEMLTAWQASRRATH